MNMDLRICYIKEEIRYSNISLDYFIKCFDILNNLIKMEYYNGALSFANILQNATVILDSSTDQKVYFGYFNKLKDIIYSLNTKLQVQNIKIR